MLHGELGIEDKVRMALGMFALHRAICHLGMSSEVCNSYDFKTLFRLYCKRGSDGSRSQALLHYRS